MTGYCLAIILLIGYGVYRYYQYQQSLQFIISLLPESLSLNEVLTKVNNYHKVNLRLSQEGTFKLGGQYLTPNSLKERMIAKLLVSFFPAIESLYQSKNSVEQSAKLSALGEMAAGIAHEINNPLAIVHGISQVISLQLQQAQNTGKLDLATLVKQSQDVMNTIHRIDQIVNSLRYFVWDDVRNPPQEASIQEILDNLLVLSAEKSKRLGVKISLNNQLTATDTLFCKPMQISQVLINLVNNSFDAVDHLSEKWIKINISGDEQQIFFQVQDSGKGIPESIQENILKPFYTNKVSSKSSGMGLGLSIVKRIIDQHKGSIKIDNQQPHTTFEITIPRRHNENCRN